jgi:hypothetical protein
MELLVNLQIFHGCKYTHIPIWLSHGNVSLICLAITNALMRYSFFLGSIFY